MAYRFFSRKRNRQHFGTVESRETHGSAIRLTATHQIGRAATEAAAAVDRPARRFVRSRVGPCQFRISPGQSRIGPRQSRHVRRDAEREHRTWRARLFGLAEHPGSRNRRLAQHHPSRRNRVAERRGNDPTGRAVRSTGRAFRSTGPRVRSTGPSGVREKTQTVLPGRYAARELWTRLP